MLDLACSLLGNLQPPSLSLGRATRVLRIGDRNSDADETGQLYKKVFGQETEYISIRSTGRLPQRWVHGLAPVDIITSDASPSALREFEFLFTLLHPEGGIYMASEKAFGDHSSSTNSTSAHARMLQFGSVVARRVHGLSGSCGMSRSASTCLKAFTVHVMTWAVFVMRYDSRINTAPQDAMFGVADPTMPAHGYMEHMVRHGHISQGPPEVAMNIWANAHDRLLHKAHRVSDADSLLVHSGKAGQECWPCQCEPNPLHKWAETYRGPVLWKIQGYFDVYHHALCGLRNRLLASQRKIRILELGVNTGGGIHMWRHYFGPRLEYHGVDMNMQCKRFEDVSNGVHIHIGWLPDKAFLSEVVRSMGGFGSVDFVSDDAAHDYQMTMSSFEVLWPAVNRNHGAYMIEDLAPQPATPEHFISIAPRGGSNLQAHMIKHFEGILVVSH